MKATSYRIIFAITIFIFFSSIAKIGFAQEPNTPSTEVNKKLNDGPYIFYDNDVFFVKNITKGVLSTESYPKSDVNIINNKYRILIDTNLLFRSDQNTINFTQEYNNIDKVVAISDIHGQLKVMVKLLKKHKVIDRKENWAFGSGHLVVVGDIFDRGDKLTEILWLIYNLEKQAEKAGGKIHFLIGNHEEMVLNNDLRYVSEKYNLSSDLIGLTYHELFAINSVLGNWVRSKPVLIKINDILFSHAGISPEFVKDEVTIEQANRSFYNNLNTNIAVDSLFQFLTTTNGPIWYRGYFKDNGLDITEVDRIIKYFDVNHIVVGHTSLHKIFPYHNTKIIGIDSNIKLGKSGEILILENGEFYRGTIKGKRIKL